MLPEQTRRLAFGDRRGLGNAGGAAGAAVIDEVTGSRPAGGAAVRRRLPGAGGAETAGRPLLQGGVRAGGRPAATGSPRSRPRRSIAGLLGRDARRHPGADGRDLPDDRGAVRGSLRGGLLVVALDMTNFATFIAAGNGKAPVAQRGKAKQKRSDLRLVGLGLVVARDRGIPLTWHAYPGDRPDVTQFTAIIDRCSPGTGSHRRGLHPGQRSDMTVVFDARQNSEQLHPPRRRGLHYIGRSRPRTART